MKKPILLLFAILIFAAQFALLSFLILRWETIVTQGTICRFTCQGFDPHDPFRGRYVRISPVVNNVPASTQEKWGCEKKYIQIDPTGQTNGLSRIIAVADAPSTDGVWANIMCDPRCNPSDNQSTNDVPAVRFYWRPALPDTFFMNEKIAPRADRMLRDLLAQESPRVIAVYRVYNHHIVLTDIEIGGKSLADIVRAESEKSTP